jgi:hypothetical protein
MFFKLLILSTIFLALAAVGMGIRMLLKSNGKFPHISRNPEMRKRGITCAQQNDTGCHSTEDFPGCTSCSSNVL